jgi:hypothetical protein
MLALRRAVLLGAPRSCCVLSLPGFAEFIRRGVCVVLAIWDVAQHLQDVVVDAPFSALWTMSCLLAGWSMPLKNFCACIGAWAIGPFSSALADLRRSWLCPVGHGLCAARCRAARCSGNTGGGKGILIEWPCVEGRAGREGRESAAVRGETWG